MSKYKNELAAYLIDDGQPIRGLSNYIFDNYLKLKGIKWVNNINYEDDGASFIKVENMINTPTECSKEEFIKALEYAVYCINNYEV